MSKKKHIKKNMKKYICQQILKSNLVIFFNKKLVCLILVSFRRVTNSLRINLICNLSQDDTRQRSDMISILFSSNSILPLLENVRLCTYNVY